MKRNWFNFRGDSLLERKRELIAINYFLSKILNGLRSLPKDLKTLKSLAKKKKLRKIQKDTKKAIELVTQMEDQIEIGSGKRKFRAIRQKLEIIDQDLEKKVVNKRSKLLTTLIKDTKNLYRRIKYEEDRIDEIYLGI